MLPKVAEWLVLCVGTFCDLQRQFICERSSLPADNYI